MDCIHPKSVFDFKDGSRYLVCFRCNKSVEVKPADKPDTTEQPYDINVTVNPLA